jgi:hypothetical protein
MPVRAITANYRPLLPFIVILAIPRSVNNVTAIFLQFCNYRTLDTFIDI